MSHFSSERAVTCLALFIFNTSRS